MWTRTDLTATFWFLNILCIILVSIRVYVRVTTVYRPWREILVILALLMQIIYCITQIFTYYRFHLYDMLVPGHQSIHAGEVTPEEWAWLWKILFINQFTTGVGVVAYQAVLMLMYMDLCSRQVFPKIWILIMFNWALLAASFGVAIIYTFWGTCPGHHFSFFWNGDGTCNNNTYLIVRNAMSDIDELLLYIIPILIVLQLPNLSKLQKISIAAMFSVGFINLGLFIVNTLVFAFNLHAWYNPDLLKTIWSQKPSAVGFAQFCQGLFIPTGLIVVCMPQLRVLGRWKFARRVVKSVTRTIGVGTQMSPSVAETQRGDETAERTGNVDLEGRRAVEKNIMTVVDEEKGIVENARQISSSSSS